MRDDGKYFRIVRKNMVYRAKKYLGGPVIRPAEMALYVSFSAAEHIGRISLIDHH